MFIDLGLCTRSLHPTPHLSLSPARALPQHPHDRLAVLLLPRGILVLKQHLQRREATDDEGPTPEKLTYRVLEDTPQKPEKTRAQPPTHTTEKAHRLADGQVVGSEDPDRDEGDSHADTHGTLGVDPELLSETMKLLGLSPSVKVWDARSVPGL
jgi:hypothetical protein